MALAMVTLVDRPAIGSAKQGEKTSRSSWVIRREKPGQHECFNIVCSVPAAHGPA